MATVGMIVAVELEAVLQRYGGALTERQLPGYRICEYQGPRHRLVVVHSRAGQISAAAATQLLICEYHPDLVLNFGLVGALTPALAGGSLCIVRDVVHYEYDTSAVNPVPVGRHLDQPDVKIPADPALLEKVRALQPGLIPVTCASGDKFIADPGKKQALARQFGADICEMEAAGILITCRRCGVPCLLIKVVSDGLRGGAAEFRRRFGEASARCLDTVDALLEQL